MSTEDADEDKSSDVECPTCGRDDFANRRGMKVHHNTKHDESISERSQKALDYDCPWDGCNFASSSQRGLGVHHSRAHGEKLPKPVVECLYCGTAKEVFWRTLKRQDRHFCDSSCFGEWLVNNPDELAGPAAPTRLPRTTVHCDWCDTPKQVLESRIESQEHHFCDPECVARWQAEAFAGEKSSRYSRVEVDCTYCGSPKMVYRCLSDQEHHFCNSVCQVNWQSEELVGENSNAWRGGGVAVTCEQCGDGKEVNPRHYEQHDRFFCNPTCHGNWQSETGFLSGSNSPRWSGGLAYYGEGWDETTKERVRKSQARCCLDCGKPEHELPFRLPVHHIVKARSLKDAPPEVRNGDDNLVALCPECHARWEKISPLRPQIVSD